VFEIIRLLILQKTYDLTPRYARELYGPKDMIGRIDRESRQGIHQPFDYAPFLDLFTLEGPLDENSEFVTNVIYRKSLNDIYKEIESKVYGIKLEELKRVAKEKADIIQRVSHKDQIIDALSAEEQFQLAQEYDLINRVLEVIQPESNTTSFRDSYYLCLKKAAANGYQPAKEELVQLYSKGYVQKKYSARGGKYDPRFVQEESIFISPEEAAAYQQAVREAKEAKDAEFTDFLMGVE